MNNIVKCTVCDWKSTVEREIASPQFHIKEGNDTVVGCPECWNTHIIIVCDSTGCEEEGRYEWEFDGQWHNTCLSCKIEHQNRMPPR